MFAVIAFCGPILPMLPMPMLPYREASVELDKAWRDDRRSVQHSDFNFAIHLSLSST